MRFRSMVSTPKQKRTPEQPSRAARRGSSARRPGGSRHQASGDDPPVIRPELEAEPFVIDPKIAVAAASDRIGSHRLHFLRDHPDIGLVAAIVCEAVVTKTVVEPTEQHDVVLEPDVRPAPTTAPAATAKAATAATAAAESGSPTSSAGEPRPSTTASARSRPKMSGSGRSTMRESTSRPMGSHIPRRSSAVSRLQVAGRSAGTCLSVCPTAVGALSAVSDVRPIGAGAQSLPVRAWSLIGVAEPLLQVGIVIARPLSMPHVMPPVLDTGAVIDVDGSAAPVNPTSAPITSAAPVPAGGPPPKCVGRAERQARRDDAGANVRLLPCPRRRRVCRRGETMARSWPPTLFRKAFDIKGDDDLRWVSLTYAPQVL